MTAAVESQPATQAPSSPKRLSRAVIVIVALLVLGAALRIARWTHPRCLWLDEIYLAGSIVPRTLHDLLFHPLASWQAAPPGFLILEHLCQTLFGSGERSLRLVSLIFGLLSLPLIWAVSRRVMGSRGVIIAVASFCFLGPLIYYSSELKPYGCDVVVSLAVTLAALRWLDDQTAKRAAVAAIVGAIGLFFSFPAVFVLAGAGIWMVSQSPGSKKQLLTIGAVWFIAFAADYVVFLRPFATSDAHPHLVDYWIAQNAFMPHRPADMLQWIFASLDRLARSPGGMWLDCPDAALIGLIIGAAVAIHRRGKLLLLLAPLPIALLASAVRQYPFADRLALFFVPQYLMLLAAGLERLWTNLAGKAAVVAIAGCVILPSADRALTYLFFPTGREESLPAYQWVAQRYQPGDVVYLTHFAEPSFQYYESQSHWPVDLARAGALHIQPGDLQPWQIIDDAKPLAGHARVWLIAIHAEGGEFSAQIATETAFNQIGHPVLTHAEPGAIDYLYDCTTPASSLAPAPPH
jgi:hypothetical protein